MADTTTAPAEGNTNTAADTTTATATQPADGASTTPTKGAETTLTKAAPEGKGDAAGEAKASDTAPADIQINVPKGVAVDQGMMDSFKGIAKEIGLTTDTAQKMADWYFKTNSEAAQKFQSGREEMITKWAEEAKTDKEIGGDKFDGSVKLAQSALRQFGSPALTQILNETGLGNHREMIALFAKIGKAVSEDKTPKGPTEVGDAKPQRDLAELLYPTMHTTT